MTITVETTDGLTWAIKEGVTPIIEANGGLTVKNGSGYTLATFAPETWSRAYDPDQVTEGTA